MSPDSAVEFSRRYLREIISAVPQPCCLIGGWSVYLTLNEKFENATGREYIGSRDIDLGFHFDPKWNQKEFENSPFSKAIAKISAMGFEPESYRFVKRFHLAEKRELTPEEARRLPLYDIFNLYIDVLVDSTSPTRFKRAGFTVLEEPLLSKVFAGKDQVATKLDGIKVTMPSPQLLMEMKVRSFPLRTADDKKTKDLLDLCALLLYSGLKPSMVNNNPEGGKVTARYAKAIDNTTKEEWKYVSESLGISESEARRIARLVR